MRLRRSLVLVSTALLLLAAAPGAVLARPDLASRDGLKARIYRLERGSSFQQGCFPPCDCPLLEPLPARGTFVLSPAGFDGDFRVFDVLEVNWSVPIGDPELHVTGSGTYRVGGEPLQQRLELVLAVGDDPPQKFDSGLVGGSAFPDIRLSISVNEMQCFDTVFRLDAAPVPVDQIHPFRLLDESTFQRGCFPPCLCPVLETAPVRGTFDLVELEANWLFTDFAVVGVRWEVKLPDGATASPLPVGGAGFYRRGGEFAAQQRMSLDLRIGDEPVAHFDSGLVVGGGSFPHIQVKVSENGMVCNDTVFGVDAAPSKRRRLLP